VIVRAQLTLAVAALSLLGACPGPATHASSADDERSRMLVRAGTAPPQRIEDVPEAPGTSLSEGDAALVRAGTLPTGEATDGAGENPLDAEYRDAPALSAQDGRASYYHDSLAGNPTATGEPYDPRAFTCASRTLPFGTIVRVVRRDDETKRVVVRVNDRGPFGDTSRLLDLSRAAAEALDSVHRGIADVRVEVLVRGDGPEGHGRARRGHRRGRR
jgi:rare lipoprotein A